MAVDIKEIKKLPVPEKRKLLWELLDDLEDAPMEDQLEQTEDESEEVIAMLEQRLADVQSGKSKTYPWEEVKAILKKNMEEYRFARYGKH